MRKKKINNRRLLCGKWCLAVLVSVVLVTGMACRKGYGLCVAGGEMRVSVGDRQFYPMHSVVKFPQALYVADYLNSHGISLDSVVVVRQSQLMRDTWSPMIDMMEPDSMAFSFRQLLELSLVESDNNACDLLFEYCGMPEKVAEYIRSIGFGDIRIVATERQMHDRLALADGNCCTPSEMVRLLQWFVAHKDDNVYMQAVWEMMGRGKTGNERIPSAVPEGARVVHKTGTGPVVNGRVTQINDVGVVLMPDGRVWIVAAFVHNPESPSQIAEIVGQRMQGVW